MEISMVCAYLHTGNVNHDMYTRRERARNARKRIDIVVAFIFLLASMVYKKWCVCVWRSWDDGERAESAQKYGTGKCLVWNAQSLNTMCVHTTWDLFYFFSQLNLSHIHEIFSLSLCFRLRRAHTFSHDCSKDHNVPFKWQKWKEEKFQITLTGLLCVIIEYRWESDRNAYTFFYSCLKAKWVQMKVTDL